MMRMKSCTTLICCDFSRQSFEETRFHPFSDTSTAMRALFCLSALPPSGFAVTVERESELASASVWSVVQIAGQDKKVNIL